MLSFCCTCIFINLWPLIGRNLFLNFSWYIPIACQYSYDDWASIAEERCKLCSCCTKLQIVNTCACLNALEIISLHASLIVRGTEIGSHWVNCNFFSPAKTFSIYIELLAKQLTLRCYIFNYSTTKKHTLLYSTVSWWLKVCFSACSVVLKLHIRVEKMHVL